MECDVKVVMRNFFLFLVSGMLLCGNMQFLKVITMLLFMFVCLFVIAFTMKQE